MDESRVGEDAGHDHRFARGLIAGLVLVTSLLVTVAAGAAGPAPTAQPFDFDAEDCTEAVPAKASITGITDDGHAIALDVHILLDGVTRNRGADVVSQMQKAYTPLNIRLRATFQEVSIPAQRQDIEFPLDTEPVPVSDSGYLFQESKKAVGGSRPPNIDVVYLLTSDRIAGGTAGVADCIGGIRYPNRAFGIGEEEADNFHSPTLNFCCTWATAKIAAHEIAHLLGAHHHYANCAEAAPTAVEDRHSLTCTLMFNDVGGVNLHFSTLEGAVVRGHALMFAERPPESSDPTPTPRPSTEPSPQPSSEPTPQPSPRPSTEPSPEPSPEPSAEPTPEPSPLVTHSRSIRLTLVRHLVARGTVAAGDATVCIDEIEVTIEKRRSGAWVPVARTTTDNDGRFRTKLTDRAGRFRATMPTSSGTETGSDYTCEAAASNARQHRHA